MNICIKPDKKPEVPGSINAATFAEMDAALKEIRRLYAKWQELSSALEADETVDKISEVLERIGH